MKKKVIKGWVPDGEDEEETLRQIIDGEVMGCGIYDTPEQCAEQEELDAWGDSVEAHECTVTITVKHKEK